MSERLLRFTRNDNVPCAVKVHGRCHCEGLFRSNLPVFIKEIWLRLRRAIILPYKSFLFLQVFSQPYLSLVRRYCLFIREGLLRFTRNDNMPCAIKVHGRCHCEGPFSKQSPHFHKGNLVAAVLRYEIVIPESLCNS